MTFYKKCDFCLNNSKTISTFFCAVSRSGKSKNHHQSSMKFNRFLFPIRLDGTKGKKWKCISDERNYNYFIPKHVWSLKMSLWFMRSLFDDAERNGPHITSSFGDMSRVKRWPVMTRIGGYYINIKLLCHYDVIFEPHLEGKSQMKAYEMKIRDFSSIYDIFIVCCSYSEMTLNNIFSTRGYLFMSQIYRIVTWKLNLLLFQFPFISSPDNKSRSNVCIQTKKRNLI